MPQIYIIRYLEYHHYLEYQYKFSSIWALDSKGFWASLASWLNFFVFLFQSTKHTPIFFQQFFCYHQLLYSKHVCDNNFFVWNHHRGVSNVIYNKYFVVTLIWHLSMFVLGGGCNLETFRYKLIRQLFHLWCFQTIDISMCVHVCVYICRSIFFPFFFQYLY